MAVSLEDIYRELQEIKRSMVTREELEETIEILNDPGMMDAIEQGKEDFRKGRVYEVRSSKDLFDVSDIRDPEMS